MANQVVASNLISNLSLAKLKLTSPYIMTSDRSYDPDFMNAEYQAGQVLNVRKRVRYIANEGRISPDQDTIEDTIPIAIQPQLNCAVTFDSRELALYITKEPDKYQQRYGDPVVEAIVGKLETRLAEQGKTQVNYFAGSPTSEFSDFGMLNLVNAQMTTLGMPREGRVNCVLHANDMAAMQTSNQNAFNTTLNQDISFGAKLGRFSRFDLYESGNAIIHTAGSGAGTPLVSGAVSSGFTITVDGLTPLATNVFRAGDAFTIGNINDATGVQSMHPITHQPTGSLMQFAVAADVNADGAGVAVITISAPTDGIISDPADPRVNVSQAIPDNATINLVGAGMSYRIAYAYVDRGLALVLPPMPYVPAVECAVAKDTEHGLSLRVVRGYDVTNDIAKGRMDIIWGGRFFDQYAIKIISKV